MITTREARLKSALKGLLNQCWLDTERHLYVLNPEGGRDVAAVEQARQALDDWADAYGDAEHARALDAMLADVEAAEEGE